MASQRQSVTKAEADASTHHSRYPARLHSHLEAAADAAEAVAAPLPVEEGSDPSASSEGLTWLPEAEEGVPHE